MPKSIKNRYKIDQKLKSKMECLLASIFEEVWWFWGAKLGAKIEGKNDPKSKVLRRMTILIFGGPGGGGGLRIADGDARNPGPPNKLY